MNPSCQLAVWVLCCTDFTAGFTTTIEFRSWTDIFFFAGLLAFFFHFWFTFDYDWGGKKAKGKLLYFKLRRSLLFHCEAILNQSHSAAPGEHFSLVALVFPTENLRNGRIGISRATWIIAPWNKSFCSNIWEHGPLSVTEKEKNMSVHYLLGLMTFLCPILTVIGCSLLACLQGGAVPV